MSTIKKNRTFGRRNAALVAAAAAITAGSLGQVASANASPLIIEGHVAIATDGKKGGVGMSGRVFSGMQEAKDAALLSCGGGSTIGAEFCHVAITGTNECIAVATVYVRQNDGIRRQVEQTARASTLQAAEGRALSGGHPDRSSILASVCSPFSG